MLKDLMTNRPGYRPPAAVRADHREIIDSLDRRIGHMWPEDYEAILRTVFGKSWVKDFARYAGMSRDQVDKYRHGENPIPKIVALMVTMLYETAQRQRGRDKTKFVELDTFWLDEIPNPSYS